MPTCLVPTCLVSTCTGVDLSGADLRMANLSGANLSGANLFGVDLSGANLSGAKSIPSITNAQASILPESGQFQGWKKCRNGVLVRVMIGKNAKRSNATGRKCRAEYVKVLEVIGAEVGISQHDNKLNIVRARSYVAINGTRIVGLSVEAESTSSLLVLRLNNIKSGNKKLDKVP